jgi:hypothetical protein
MTYDPHEDGRLSYEVAIAALRERLLAARRRIVRLLAARGGR